MTRALASTPWLVAAVLAALSLVAGCSAAPEAASEPTSADDARPVGSTAPAAAFHDAFDGAHLAADRWTTCYWWDHDGCTNLGNDEAEWYVPEQATVRAGVLHLRAEPRPSEHLGRAFSHASGMVTTGRTGDPGEDEPRFAFTYGRVEVRFRTPRGAGLWPAIWMLPATNRSLPEIDLLEQYGDDTTTAKLTLHTPGPGGGEEGKRTDRQVVRGADLSRGWHTVGIDWRPGRLRWFLDGAERYRVEGDRVPSEPMYLLVDLAVGGPAGPVAPTPGGAELLVDEVTVWAA